MLIGFADGLNSMLSDLCIFRVQRISNLRMHGIWNSKGRALMDSICYELGEGIRVLMGHPWGGKRASMWWWGWGCHR